MKAFRIIKAFLMRDAAMALSYPLDFVLRVFTMLVTVFIIVVGSKFIRPTPGMEIDFDQYGGYLPFVIIGMFMFEISRLSFDTFARAIRGEQMMGTLEAVMMAPIRLSMILVGSASWSFFWASIPAMLLLVIAHLFLGLQMEGSYIFALVFIMLTSLIFCSLGILSASFIMVFKRGNPIGIFVNSFSILLGGVLFPTQVLPGWVQAISNFIPLTHGINGMRSVVFEGASVTSVLPEMMILILFAVITVPASLFCFQQAVKIAQREGTLLQY